MYDLEVLITKLLKICTCLINTLSVCCVRLLAINHLDYLHSIYWLMEAYLVCVLLTFPGHSHWQPIRNLYING